MPCKHSPFGTWTDGCSFFLLQADCWSCLGHVPAEWNGFPVHTFQHVVWAASDEGYPDIYYVLHRIARKLSGYSDQSHHLLVTSLLMVLLPREYWPSTHIQ
jgi:hypothetical protein